MCAGHPCPLLFYLVWAPKGPTYKTRPNLLSKPLFAALGLGWPGLEEADSVHVVTCTSQNQGTLGLQSQIWHPVATWSSLLQPLWASVSSALK